MKGAFSASKKSSPFGAPSRAPALGTKPPPQQQQQQQQQQQPPSSSARQLAKVAALYGDPDLRELKELLPPLHPSVEGGDVEEEQAEEESAKPRSKRPRF